GADQVRAGDQSQDGQGAWPRGARHTARARRRGDRMIRRREFVTVIGGAAVAWPLTALAQQPERMRRVGVLLGGAATDRPEPAGLGQGLEELGWRDDRKFRIEYRSGLGSAADTRRYAQELAALAPDVIMVNGATPLTGLLAATRTIPIVFTGVADPVGTGFV